MTTKVNETYPPEQAQLTKKCASEKREKWNIDDGRGDVDEPVGQKRSDPQENDVIEEVVLLLLNLQNWNIRLFIVQQANEKKLRKHFFILLNK